MSRIKFERSYDGMTPSEKVVQFLTADGVLEEVVVSDRQIKNGGFDAYRIYDTPEKVLVELPRESASGSWRIWVPANSVTSDPD